MLQARTGDEAKSHPQGSVGGKYQAAITNTAVFKDLPVEEAIGVSYKRHTTTSVDVDEAIGVDYKRRGNVDVDEAIGVGDYLKRYADVDITEAIGFGRYREN
ncbi:hypothetical protein H0H81_001329, partial [Sphagnurus paluster]